MTSEASGNCYKFVVFRVYLNEEGTRKQSNYRKNKEKGRFHFLKNYTHYSFKKDSNNNTLILGRCDNITKRKKKKFNQIVRILSKAILFWLPFYHICFNSFF